MDLRVCTAALEFICSAILNGAPRLYQDGLLAYCLSLTHILQNCSRSLFPHDVRCNHNLFYMTKHISAAQMLPRPPHPQSSPPPPHTSLLQLPFSTCGRVSSIPFINSFLMLPDGLTVIHGDLRAVVCAVVCAWVCRCSYPQNLHIAGRFVCVF